jgi:hypothetical protein
VKQRNLRVSFAKEARHDLVDRYPPGLTRGQIDLGHRSVYVRLCERQQTTARGGSSPELNTARSTGLGWGWDSFEGEVGVTANLIRAPRWALRR